MSSQVRDAFASQTLGDQFVSTAISTQDNVDPKLKEEVNQMIDARQKVLLYIGLIASHIVEQKKLPKAALQAGYTIKRKKGADDMYGISIADEATGHHTKFTFTKEYKDILLDARWLYNILNWEINQEFVFEPDASVDVLASLKIEDYHGHPLSKEDFAKKLWLTMQRLSDYH